MGIGLFEIFINSLYVPLQPSTYVNTSAASYTNIV